MNAMSLGTPAPDTRQTVAELLACARHLEQGQADCPLQRELEACDAPSNAPLLVVVAAESAAARARIGAWLLKLPALAAEQSLFESRPCLEIALVADITELAPRPPGDPAGKPLVIRRAGIDPVTLIAVDFDSIQRQGPWLLDRLRAQPNLLVLESGGMGRAQSQLQAIDLIKAGACASLEAGHGGGMWRQVVPGSEGSDPPSPILGPGSEALRLALGSVASLRRAAAAAQLIQERQGLERRQLHSRRKRDQIIERGPPAGQNDSDIKQVVDEVRTRVGEEFGRLGHALRERGRRAGLRTGSIFQLLDEQLGRLNEDDLERETLGKKIRLTLHSRAADDLKAVIAAALRAEIEADVALIAETFSRIMALMDPLSQALSLEAEPPRVEKPAVEVIWTPIEEALFVQARYRGEVPKRGFLQRLGEGRRVVFVVLMMGSLAGGFMGFNIRRAAGMGPVFLLLFLGVVAYTFYSWKAEDREIMETELSRLRDVLSTEFVRLLQDALRDRQMRFGAVVEEARRQFLANLDGLQRDAVAVKASRAEAARRAARARLRSLDARLKTLESLAQSVAKARQNLEPRLAETLRQAQSAVANGAGLAAGAS